MMLSCMERLEHPAAGTFELCRTVLQVTADVSSRVGRRTGVCSALSPLLRAGCVRRTKGKRQRGNQHRLPRAFVAIRWRTHGCVGHVGPCGGGPLCRCAAAHR